MSTQSQDGIAFSLAHEQQSFRLLELPAELLDIITAPNPPRLSIKSAEPSISTTSKPSFAVLCTLNKTYELRQVQTSNSVFITQAYTAIDETGQPKDGINAIATCSTTLELHPIIESASDYLLKLLPLWHADSSLNDPIQNFKSKTQILADVPVSDEECEIAWTEKCAFEYEKSCYRPTTEALRRIWKDMFEAATAESIDLSAMFLVQELWKAADDQAMDAVPRELVEAIVRRLVPDDEVVEEGWARLDQTKTVHFIGIVLLEARSGDDASLLTADYLDSWRNQLPEKWRESAQLETIKGHYTLPTSTTIAWIGSNQGTVSQGSSSASKASAGARKWHEKFKKGKK